MYNSNINRLRAEEDMRFFQLLIASEDGESIKKVFDLLRQENGNPVIFEMGRDPDALDQLKALSEKINGGRTISNPD